MPGPEQIIQALPIPVGSRGPLVSPLQFATTANDAIRVSAWCLQPLGIIFGQLPGLTVVIRSLDTSGASQLLTDTFLLATDGTVTTRTYPQAAGYVQTIAITWANGGVVSRGPTHCVVELVTGTPPNAGLVVAQILGGPVGVGQGLAWPGSPVVGPLEAPGFFATDAGLMPAPGAEVFYNFPTHRVGRLLSVQVVIVTSAAPGTRYVNLIGPAWFVPPAAGVAPSSAMRIVWAPGVGPNVPAGSAFTVAPMPEWTLFDADVIRTSTVGLAAGDQFSGFALSYQLWLGASQ